MQVAEAAASCEGVSFTRLCTQWMTCRVKGKRSGEHSFREMATAVTPRFPFADADHPKTDEQSALIIFSASTQPHLREG